MGQLLHPNLVKLIGYCLEDGHRLLVYEFVPNGSLENRLFGRDSHIRPLSWNLRMKVALGAAKCLAFLHDKADVIHGDFRTSNILLDSNYNAKLCDLGFAKDGPIDKSHVTTRVLGGYGLGYATPEYAQSEIATSSLDSDGGPTRVGLGSPERGASPHKEGEINSPTQNPPEVALTSNDLNKRLGKTPSAYDDVVINFSSSDVNAMLEAQRNNSQMIAKLLQTMNIFMEKVTGGNIDVVDSPVNRSPTSKSFAKEENKSSFKCAKELGGQLPRSPLRGTDSGRALTEERLATKEYLEVDGAKVIFREELTFLKLDNVFIEVQDLLEEVNRSTPGNSRNHILATFET
ncbi:hypothetical protein JCGZ_06623 [Jatropha curcas]|uniref:Protein kinase domain-containing protein n=1 Tax=Jatropha curcas TaxID=180498 RepID=A0A067LCI0_JATCU|nr:hypothetical protein JCGZ_06623 [Jatropha curcas]